MLSSSKRVVTSLGQGRWNAAPSWHPAQSSARTIRSSPHHEAEEIEFSGNDVSSGPVLRRGYRGLNPRNRMILYFQYYERNLLFVIQRPI
jgi:hypothetical protein